MTTTISDADIAAFQMIGQDIPWQLEHWATHRPDHPFLVWEPKDGNDRTWTYREFVDDVNRVAAGLADRGVTKGDKVLIHADNCPEGVLAWYACARLGAVGVTTNNRSVANELNYFATHTGCVGAVTQPQYAALIAEAAPELKWTVVTADNSGVPASEDELAHGNEPFESLFGSASSVPDRPAEPMLPAGIVFTSGTTSRPKAVVHTHANALWAGRVAPDNIELDADSVYLASLPFFHVNTQSWAIWSVLGVGGTVVLQPKFSTSRFWEVVAKHGVSHISLLPFVIQSIMNDKPAEHTVKIGVFGLIMPVLDELLGLRVVAAYGMTETVIHAIHGNRFEKYPDMSMGKPTAGYQAIVVDPDTGEVCTDGRNGELWMRGTRGIQLFLEYYDNPEANAKAFTDDGWLRTGDIVRMGDNGNFFYCDRDKDALKVGGENVSAREVEDTCRQVPGIADIAVVAKSHERLDMIPVAFVIRNEMAAPPDEMAEAIIEACRTNLADFKVPRAVYFVDEFPKATLDKVAKNQLRDMADEHPAIA